MNSLKRIILLGAVALAATFGAVLDSQAQFFGGIAGGQSLTPFAATNYNSTGSIISGAWNTAYPLPPATSTNATFPLVDCYNSHSVALSLSASGTTNTATTTLSIIRSTDGVLWETTPFVLLSVSCPTGTATTINTNFDIGAFRYWTALGWTNSASISNAAVRYGIKPGF